MARLYLVRHAQTLWNGENRLQGHSDTPLSAIGRDQAGCLARCFAARRLRGIFTSALQRSRQTAEAIASGLRGAGGNGRPLTPVVDADLAEMHLGMWEGLTPEEIDRRFRHAYRRWRVRPSAVAIPDAESFRVFRARTRRAWRRLAAGLEDGEYVVVSHGGVIVAWLADVLGADYDALIRRLRLDNAGITAVELGPRAPHVLWINATAHLDPLAAKARGGWY